MGKWNCSISIPPPPSAFRKIPTDHHPFCFSPSLGPLVTGRTELAEQAYDKQFSYVPTQTLAQYLIECRRCHRQLPEERFRGSPTKLREYKATHQPTASP